MISKSPDPAGRELMIIDHKKHQNKYPKKTPKLHQHIYFPVYYRVKRVKSAFQARSLLSASREVRRLSFACKTVWQGQSSDRWTDHGRNQLYLWQRFQSQCISVPFLKLLQTSIKHSRKWEWVSYSWYCKTALWDGFDTAWAPVHLPMARLFFLDDKCAIPFFLEH